MRALGVRAARSALPQLAAVPTFAEGGVPGVEADAWSALFAPAKTPPAVIERLYRAVAAALAKDAVRAEHGASRALPVALKTPGRGVGHAARPRWRNGRR